MLFPRPFVKTSSRIFVRYPLALLCSIVLLAYGSGVRAAVPGNIPAEFSVNNGSASYSVPIDVAPGRGGMQPELSINYSSNGGNGILGVGWSLGGLSAISRCGRTVAQDGAVSGINFDKNDRYCLDGQRLVPVKGANGAVGAEYRTEIDSYAKITSHGGSTNKPNYWVVKTKAGQVMTYGQGGNSTHTFSQGPMSWAIREANDTTGKNPVTYHYSINSYKQYLNRISYAGGNVEFGYETTTARQSFFKGQAITANKRLVSISTFVNNSSVLNEFTFDYDIVGADKRSQLKALHQCDDSNRCLKPLKFEWGDTVASSNQLSNSAAWVGGGSGSDKAQFHFGDFNGDGLTDHFYHRYDAYDGKLRLYLGQTNGSFKYKTAISGSKSAKTVFYFSDYNGDGIADNIYHNYDYEDGKLRVRLGRGDGTFGAYKLAGGGSASSKTKFHFNDYDGDGILDYIYHNYDASEGQFKLYLGKGDGTFKYKTAYSGSKSSKTVFYFGDYNGDGIIDNLYHNHDYEDGKFRVRLGKGDGTFGSFKFSGGGSTSTKTKFYFDDYNNDGILDHTYHKYDSNEGKLRVFLGKGDGTFKLAHTISGSTSTKTNFYFGDFNGDGITDNIYHNYDYADGKLRLRLGKGDGSYTGYVWSGSGSKWPKADFYFGDYNGDGMVDHIQHLYDYDGGPLRVRLNKGSLLHNKIVKITDSSTNETQLSYKSLSSSTVYSKGTGATFPLIDIATPIQVVSRVRSDAGIGSSTNIVDYTYKGLKLHAHGRGVLGFRQITASYPDTGKEERSYYKFGTYPILGVLEKVEERHKSRLINTKDNRYISRKNGKVFELIMDRSIDKSYELTGPTTPVTTVTTWYQNFDVFGNPRRVVVSTAADGQDFRKYTDSVYTNDTAKWHLGRLTRNITTHRSPGNPDQKRRVDFKYNAQGLLSEEKVVSAANPATWLTRTQHAYNSFGQKTKTTTSAPGQQNRITTYSRDGLQRLQKVCNAYNECSTNTYDSKSRLASTTGANGLKTSWQYDGLGRQTRENRADGTWTTTAYGFANQGMCRPNNDSIIDTAYTCVVSQTKGSPKAVVQLDKFGRTVRTVKKGFDGRLSYSDTEYDRFGRVTRVSRDYYAGDYVYWATSQYDALDRVKKVTQPGTHGSAVEVTTWYNGLRINTYSGPQTRGRAVYSNALGKTTKVEEPTGATVDYTHYSDGSLKSTRVNGDNTTRITLKYDEFGRKIESKDPSLGTWKYQYNGFGELTKQTNAKNQVSTLAYDKLGRLVKRVEPEGTSTWVYSSISAPKGSRGKLTQEKAPGITRDFSYDSLGRSDSISTTISGAGTFTAETSYDSNGRVKRTTYPGSSGFFTENLYNSHGYLSTVRGLRKSAESHDYRQLTPLISKAVSTANEYEIRARKLRQIGSYYQSKIDYYQNLSGSGKANTALKTQLNAHKTQLNTISSQGKALSPKFMGHLNQTLDELKAVNALITAQSQSYKNIAAQLAVLAEQTLAAADHQYQYARTYDTAAAAYNSMDNTPTGTSGWINYWKALQVDASGRMAAEVYGNGIVNDYTYNQGTGHLDAINSSLLAVDAIRHLEYEYDAYDNVTLRDDLVNDIRETYGYDRLDRLTSNEVSSSTYTQNTFNKKYHTRYDLLGNLTSKTGVGTYTYGSANSPYRLTKAGSNTYQYDANGNMTKGAGRTFAWTSYNKASKITQNGSRAEFKYGADRARFQKTNHKGDKTFYIGKLFEETRKADGVKEQRHTIYAGGAPIAEHIVSSKEGTHTRYLHKDALGSIDLITDAHAEVVDRRSFDAWGKLRDLPWQAKASLKDPLYLTQLPFTNKGYTGHEQVQEVDLINMNGRLYDATLGRFVSADPHIQAPEMSQNYNRYSYVLNNPMKYTDPSGFFFKKLFRAIKKVVKKVVSVVKQFAGAIAAIALTALCTVCAPALIGAISGAVGAAVNGGNILKGFISGGITGFASSFIGNANHIFGARRAFDIGRSIAHGVVGGTVAVINGGKFGAGFLSSAFTKFVSQPIQGLATRISSATGIAAEIVGAAGAALVGGTASVLGGGKFANGAQTAAIQYLFNQSALQLMGRGLQNRANELQTRYEEIRALEVNHTLSPQMYMDFNRDYYNLRDAIHTYHGLLGVERTYVQLQAAPFQVVSGLGLVRAGVGLATTGGRVASDAYLRTTISAQTRLSSARNGLVQRIPEGRLRSAADYLIPGKLNQLPSGALGSGTGAQPSSASGIIGWLFRQGM